MKNSICILITALLLACGTVASGQLYRTSYFMEGSPQRGAFNPAFRPYRGYIQIPALGNLNVNVTSNAFALNNLIYQRNGTNVHILNGSVTWADIEGFLRPSNDIGVDVSIPLISFGFYSGRGFWTFDTKLTTAVGASLPKEFFHFMKGADESGLQRYDLSDIAAEANAYITASLGYSHRLFDNLTIGGRVNFLGGLARATARYDKFDVSMSADAWEVSTAGSFMIAGHGVTIPEMLDDKGRYVVDFSEMGTAFKDGYRRGSLAGWGLTFDIGAEYELLDRYRFSASVLDMGFMRWDKNAISHAGIEADFEWGAELDDDLEDLMKFEVRQETPDADVKSKVYASFVLGAEFDILAGSDLLSAGVMYMNRRNEFMRRSEVSISFTVRPSDWFTASFSYALRSYKGLGDSPHNALGFALNFHPGWINLFVGTDYMFSRFNPQFIPVSQKTLNFYMGLSVPLRAEREMELPRLGI